MSICCLFNTETGALLGVSETAIEAQAGQDTIWHNRGLPDMTIEQWNPASASFFTRNCVVLTKLKFIRRFTAAEYAAIKAATQANAEVDFFWQKFMAAENVVLDDADLVSGIAGLVSFGLLTQARATEIMT